MNESEMIYRDLATRLPYGVKVEYEGEVYDLTMLTVGRQAVIVKPFMSHQISVPVEKIKPYLRTRASLTRQEKGELYKTQYHKKDAYDNYIDTDTLGTYEFYNSIHVDYRGLINKGLAIKAPDGMYGEPDTTSPSSNHYEHSFMDN
jgi:hypothetical protein